MGCGASLPVSLSPICHSSHDMIDSERWSSDEDAETEAWSETQTELTDSRGQHSYNEVQTALRKRMMMLQVPDVREMNVAAVVSSPTRFFTEETGTTLVNSQSVNSLPPLPIDPTNVTILVIDADKAVTHFVGKWLSSRGYSVITSNVGGAALQVLLQAGASEIGAHSSPPPSGELCEIDMIVCEWNISFGLMKVLDWVTNNTSLSHIPTVILCDEEVTVQDMDRLVRRGAADILRKPLLRRSFLHTIDLILTNQIQSRYTKLLQSAGDTYKRQILRARATCLSHGRFSFSLPTPKRSLSSMLHTFASASAGLVGGISPTIIGRAIEVVHAIVISRDMRMHAEITSAASSLQLEVHCCFSVEECSRMQNAMECQSNASTIISQGSRSNQVLSVRSPLSLARSGIHPTGTAPSSLFSTPVHSKSASSPQAVGDLPSSSSFFGAELILMDMASLHSEAGVSWTAEMKSRSASRQPPIVLLTDENVAGGLLIRQLYPLHVWVVPPPRSASLLCKKLTQLMEHVTILRHQRLYADRAYAYSLVVERMQGGVSPNSVHDSVDNAAHQQSTRSPGRRNLRLPLAEFANQASDHPEYITRPPLKPTPETRTLTEDGSTETIDTITKAIWPTWEPVSFGKSPCVAGGTTEDKIAEGTGLKLTPLAEQPQQKSLVMQRTAMSKLLDLAMK